jgi:hypothetical protein
VDDADVGRGGRCGCGDRKARDCARSATRARSKRCSTRFSPRTQNRSPTIRAGKEKAFNSLVGQVMKATRGKANPAQVNEILRRKLER